MKTLDSLETLAFWVKVKSERPTERKLVLEHAEIRAITKAEHDEDPETYPKDEIGMELYYGTGREHTITVSKDVYDGVEVGSVYRFNLEKVLSADDAALI